MLMQTQVNIDWAYRNIMQVNQQRAEQHLPWRDWNGAALKHNEVSATKAHRAGGNKLAKQVATDAQSTASITERIHVNAHSAGTSSRSMPEAPSMLSPQPRAGTSVLGLQASVTDTPKITCR